MSDAAAAVSFEPEEKVVFLAVMRALAHHGFLEEVEAVHADMLSFGYTECIDSLNHLLQASIVSANEEASTAIMDRIISLTPSTRFSTDGTTELASILLSDENSPTQSKANRNHGLTLPIDKMRNWNATTFAHMVDSACQDHNLEFALLLMATCYRMGMALPHQALARVIGVCLHSEEFRAAVELADLIEQGGLVYRHSDQPNSGETTNFKNLLRSEARSGQVARRLAPSIWMSILRSCAEGGYLAGVELSWSRAVRLGLLAPDDGLLLTILALAAKEGSVQMVRTCLRHIDPTFFKEGEPVIPSDQNSDTQSRPSRDLSTPAKRIEMQEWHLAPLFEAECSARNYQGAMQTLCLYHHRGWTITDRTASRISTSIYPDKASLRLALDALAHSATDAKQGTHICIVNAVMSAAVWLGDLAAALEIYRAIPSYHTIADADGKVSNRQPRFIRANLDTFNTLLSGCIDAADYDMGVELLKDLNKLKIGPDAVTYERMIVLCLTQATYDDAFGLVEEAKDKGITPSRKSFEALARKCFHNKDFRYQRVLADMSDHGYRPNRKLLQELQLETDPLSRFSS